MKYKPLDGKGWTVDANGTKLKNGGLGTVVFNKRHVRSALMLSIEEINELIPLGANRILDKVLKPDDVFNILYKNFKDLRK